VQVANETVRSRRVSDVLRRHPRHVALAALIAGLLLSDAAGWAVVTAAVAVPLVGLSTGSLRLPVIAGAILLTGAGIGTARREAIDRAPAQHLIGHAVTARGHVVKRERPTPSAYRFRMQITEVAVGSSTLKVDDLVQVRIRRGRSAWPSDDRSDPRVPAAGGQRARAIGDQLEVRGALAALPDEPADYAAYLRRAGVHAVLRADSVLAIGNREGPVAVLDGIRRRAETGVGEGLDARLAALATGIVLGQDERISAEMVEQFQASGLAHLLAVSGQNVTLLAVLALPLLGAMGLGRRARLAGVLGLICLYVPLTGAGPSIMRAGAMGAAATVAQLSGRPASRWYALMLACAFTLAIDPRAWLDAGWQLSFAAVIGIFCLGPGIRRAFRKLPAPLAEGAALTVAATLATAPLLAFHFERLSVVSLLANLLALPVVAPIMWIGTLAGASAQVSTDVAALLNALNGFCLAYLAALAGWSAHVPGAVVSIEISSPLGLVLAYLVPIAVVAGLIRTRLHPLPTAAVAVICMTVFIGRAGNTAGPIDRFTVTFIDVGQGDATLLQAPDGAAVLVDGGPPGSGVASRLRSAGVRSLDVAVLTHAQLDHQGGLEAVIRALPVQVLLDGGGHEPLHDRIVALARSRGTHVVAARAGMALHLGRLEIDVLSPKQPGILGDDPNQSSVVALASYGAIDVLLTADAESDVTGQLALSDVEVVKVAHHGSADPGLTALLERLNPEVAVIEVGASNRYGHPNPQTLSTLNRLVRTVHRTDRDGDVTLTKDSRGLSVETER
jgi:competence protein ComEC